MKCGLGVMMVVASFFSLNVGFSQTRVISHISSTEGGFTPGLILANMDNLSTQSYTILPFTKTGQALPLVQGTLAAGETHYRHPNDLFGSDDVSHLQIQGGEQLLVSTSYQGLTPESTPVHVPESKQQAPSWRIYPGDWSLSWDGLAIVNPGSEATQVTILQKDPQGQILQTQEAINVAPFAKHLQVLSDHFSAVANSHFEISAQHPIALTSLRGSIDGRILWVNIPVVQPEVPVVSSQAMFEVSKTENMAYAKGLTHSEWNSQETSTMDLLLDVYQPVGAAGRRPVMVYIHGGGFFGGSKSGNASVNLMNYFAARGFVGFTIDYRLARDRGTVPETYYQYLVNAGIPSQTLDQTLAMYTAGRDAKAAIRWIRAHAEVYHLDTQRITVAGGSAGAVTAVALGVSNNGDFQNELTLAADPTLATTHMEQSDSIHTIVDYWGSGVMVKLLTDAYGYESRWDATDRPLIIIHGTEDGTVPFSNALELETHYRQSGAQYEIIPLEGLGHGPWGAMVNGKSLYQLAFEFVVDQQQLRLIP